MSDTENKTPDSQENTEAGTTSTPSTPQDEADVFYSEGEEGTKDDKTSEDSDKENAKDTKTEDADNTDKTEDSDSDGEGKKKEDDAKEGENKVPEKYDLKIPKDSLLEKDQVEEIETFAKQQGFSNDQAQELLNREEKLLSGYKETLHQEFEEKTSQWLEDIKSDKQLGGDNYKKNIATATRVVDRFATDDFKKALNESGFGNHPELVRTFVKIGNAMSEDSFEPNAQPRNDKPIEDVFYGENK